MIRPEAAATLARWREALVGALLGGLGLYLLVTSGGLLFLFGLALGALGAFLVFSGVRHARFRTEAEAPGLLEVIEGQITYLGPVIGGSVALHDLTEVLFRRTSTGEAFWRLSHTAGTPLFIPEGARGAEALLDALAPLPGFDGGAMVRAVQTRTPTTITVWRRRDIAALT
ncbi:hypothetical protein JANAI62_07730 [Jannaschia pagri]|uniref:Uncharacterized protein n=1 Tax=Jannaschia pagri TaxID=2829797 RepID=A0ABQ4NIB1_9RHOB|nr:MULTISPECIES: hypothetical protein [unclassified Jannaschia]GIT89742.1 hypothetical protein JANAI61_02000 [Jannaschia sp. AI_61]GIT94150.1 hypothetical protein JANAI62_07730 [Jannaschia sp. AI_62]